MSLLRSRWLVPALLSTGLCVSLNAVDGVVLIGQAQALAGNVTPGDTPGFPITISVPGSYRLSGNLTVPDANTDALSITVDNVTIDLNGFSILGPSVCTGTPGIISAVISCSPSGSGKGVNGNSRSYITVVNGSIRGMGEYAINLVGIGNHVEKVHAESNGSGILVAFGVVQGNTSSFNFNDGFNVEFGVVSGNMSVGNQRYGVIASCPSVVSGNTATFNGAGSILLPFGGAVGCAVVNNAFQ